MKINRAKLRSVGCLHFEIDLPDRYVYVDVSQGRIFLLSYKLRDLMTLLCEDKQSEIAVGRLSPF